MRRFKKSMAYQAPRLLIVAALFGALLLVFSQKNASTDHAALASSGFVYSKTSSFVNAIVPDDIHTAIHIQLERNIASPVHEEKPCSMASRCSNSTCMGAFPHEDMTGFFGCQTDRWVSTAKMIRSGSDLPPPIGPPRWNS